MKSGTNARFPGMFIVDIAVMKNFDLSESVRLQLRWEMFNALNRPNFGNPYSTQQVSNRFGRPETLE